MVELADRSEALDADFPDRALGSSHLIANRGLPSEGGRPDISIIVPVYREERSIKLFLQRVEPILATVGSYEILFCYDSPDRTKELILRRYRTRESAFELQPSLRQPAAIMAGLHHCIGNSCVILDVDPRSAGVDLELHRVARRI
jgi:dolichol-phosphate mannosyltransferase